MESHWRSVNDRIGGAHGDRNEQPLVEQGRWIRYRPHAGAHLSGTFLNARSRILPIPRDLNRFHDLHLNITTRSSSLEKWSSLARSYFWHPL